MAIMPTQTVNHTISQVASHMNSSEEEHRQNVAVNKGVQLHFSERWGGGQREKRNARIAAIVFIVIGVLIASGPFLITRFQRKVASYNQSVNELVHSEPYDGPITEGFVPTFNPSMSIRDGIESSGHSPHIKSELTTIPIHPTASPSIPPTISKLSFLHTVKPTTRSTSRRNPTFSPTSKESTHNPSSLPKTTEPTGSPTTRHPISSISMLPTSDNASIYTSFRSKSSLSQNSTTILSTPTNHPITSDPITSPSMHRTTANTSNPSTVKPSKLPSRIPSSSPTTREPTYIPSNHPTSSIPTGSPTTRQPTASPSTQPTTANPTSQPPFMPTSSPTKDPNSCPSPACILNALLSWLTSNSINQPTMATTSVQSAATNPSPSPSHTNAFLTLKPTASKPSSIAYSSYSPSSDSSSVQPNSQAKPSKDPISQFASSEFFVTNATTSNTRTFSSHVRIKVKGIFELMDSGAFEVMKDNTVSFLNEQFLDLILVDDVTLISQSVVQSSEPIRALSMVSQQTRTRLKTESSADRSMVRSLTAILPPPSLVVELGVAGMITNWTAFREVNAVQINEDFMSTLLSQSISSNSEEFMDRLADESDFFPSVTPRVMSYVMTEPVSSGAGDQGRTVFQILGLVVATVALVGIFYMKRKSGVKRRRRLCDDELSRDAKFIGEASLVEFGSEDELNVSHGSLRLVSEAIVDDEAVSLENESMSAASVNSEVGSAASVDCEVSATSMHDKESQSEYDSSCETSFGTDSFDSDIEQGKDVSESSTMSSSSYSSHDDSESIEVIRLNCVANPRGSNDACEKKQSTDDACHDPKFGENVSNDSMCDSEKDKSRFGMHDEVNCSIISSTSPAAMPTLKVTGMRQLRHDGTTKQTVAFSGGDYRCGGQGGRNDEQRYQSVKYEEDTCQNDEKHEEIWQSDEQDHMRTQMVTPASVPPPAGELFDPSAKQKSMKTRKVIPKSGRKPRRRNDCMEHSAYEVVLRDH